MAELELEEVRALADRMLEEVERAVVGKREVEAVLPLSSLDIPRRRPLGVRRLAAAFRRARNRVGHY